MLQVNGSNNMNNSNKNSLPNVLEYISAEETYSDGENDSDSGTESECTVNFEREQGNGQKRAPAKKIDADLDKKNPQYIPKRGTFYEHDDRTADNSEIPEAEKTKEESQNNVWGDKKEKWRHDRFNEIEQASKSRAELIAIYGYDICNEEGSPRGRRRRKFRCGPNWEDGDVYGKPTLIRKAITGNKKGRPKSKELNEDDVIIEISENATREIVEEDKEQIPVVSKDDTKPNPPPLPFPHQHAQQREIIPLKQNILNNQNEKPQHQSVSKPKGEINDFDYRGFTKSRQFKRSPNTRVDCRKTSHNTSNQNNGQELEKNINRMSVQDAPNYKSHKHGNSKQGSMTPRLQAEQKDSKKYTSMRQRSQQQQQHGDYYPNEFTQQNQTWLFSLPQPQLLSKSCDSIIALPERRGRGRTIYAKLFAVNNENCDNQNIVSGVGDKQVEQSRRAVPLRRPKVRFLQ